MASNLKRTPQYGRIFAGHDEGEAMAELGRLFWAQYVEILDERSQLNQATRKTLDRLVRASVEYETLYPIACSEGPVRVADSGQQYANMLWSQVKNLSDKISKLEKALTLTPESVGDKSAPRALGKQPDRMTQDYLSIAQ